MYETENLDESTHRDYGMTQIRTIQLSDFLAVTRQSRSLQDFMEHFPHVYLVKMGELTGNLLGSKSANELSQSNLMDSVTCEFELPSDGIRHGAKSSESGGHSYELIVPDSQAAEFIVGRAESADLTIRDPSISGHHAEIRIDGRDNVSLRDLGSKNGTKLNNELIEAEKACAVECGDLITFGRLSLQFYRPKSLFPLLRLLTS